MCFLQVAISETMVWRAAAMLERLDLAALSPADDGQAVSTATDMPVAISLAAVSDLAASVRCSWLAPIKCKLNGAWYMVL